MSAPTEIDCLGNDECVCPYCGHEDRASGELIGDSGTNECGACARPYTYSRNVSVTYTTGPIMGPHQQDELEQRWELDAEDDRKANRR